MIDLPTATMVAAGDPGALVEQAVQACREKDGGLLRSLIATRVADDDIEALFARGADVRLAQREPADIEGGTATLVVRLEIRRPAGEIEDVQRVWDLTLDATGAWRFAALPDCY